MFLYTKILYYTWFLCKKTIGFGFFSLANFLLTKVLIYLHHCNSLPFFQWDVSKGQDTHFIEAEEIYKYSLGSYLAMDQ